MKLTTLIFFAAFLACAVAIPWRDQIALVNSLQVGRNEDPHIWSCYGCELENKPLAITVIEEK